MALLIPFSDLQEIKKTKFNEFGEFFFLSFKRRSFFLVTRPSPPPFRGRATKKELFLRLPLPSTDPIQGRLGLSYLL